MERSSSPGGQTSGPVKHLNEIELARRWGISHRTLQRWRWLKQGPSYLKLGGHIVYALADVLEYERRRRAEIKTSPVLGDWK